MMQDRGDLVTFTDGKDWLEVGVITIIGLVWVIMLFPMWRAPSETVPLWLALIFTLVPVLLAPLLFRRIRSARTRMVVVDKTTGDMSIVFRAPFWWEETTVDPSKIEGAIFSTHDNDGAWHEAKLQINGKTVTFAQGSVYSDVHGRFERMLEVLEPFCPGLPVES